MKSFFFFFLFFLAISSGCKKHKTIAVDNPYGLPNATQTGANIFACRVNGINWSLKKVSSYYLGTSYCRSNNRDTLSFGAQGIPDSLLTNIGFIIKSKIQEGATYPLDDSTKATAQIFRLFAPCGITFGYGGSQVARAVNGSVLITRCSGSYFVPDCCQHGDYDRNSIIAGTFNFTVMIPGCDSIKVTDGRFDINYSQY